MSWNFRKLILRPKLGFTKFEFPISKIRNYQSRRSNCDLWKVWDDIFENWCFFILKSGLIIWNYQPYGSRILLVAVLSYNFRRLIFSIEFLFIGVVSFNWVEIETFEIKFQTNFPEFCRDWILLNSIPIFEMEKTWWERMEFLVSINEKFSNH